MVEVTQAAQWECFQDASYYDMWCVRMVGEREFGKGFHLMRGEEAEALRNLLNTRQPDPLVGELVEAAGPVLREFEAVIRLVHTASIRAEALLLASRLRTALARWEARHGA